MSKLIDTNKPESRNWLKQWQAVYVTRQALLPTVSAEATQLHGDILQKTKAREVVNHIRHMPDISSSALTDQATTECIDNLYALLNEPGLQNRPEALQARKQLDELKTADPSKDENAYKYICKELHAEFQHKLADIEMKLQTTGADTKSIKAYLYTESLQVFQALEHFSDDAMHDLSKTKDNILLSIKEDRRRVMDNIAFLERKAIEHIEQSVTKGKRTLEDQTEILAKRLRKEEIENLQKKKLELKTQLIEYYKISSSQMTVRLDIDETIETIYEKPKLTLKKTENGTTQERDIQEVSQLFSTSDGTIAKTIIVEGEPGTGKTSLCKKIVDDWRKVKEEVEQESTKSYLRKFEFIFYIILRLVKTEIEVKAIIVEHILKKIDSGYENAHSLLGEILKSEHCLLLLDGLDEWRGKMPHIETSWLNCTTLITTRPYKLAELKVIPTQIGKHVKLDGVQNPEELVLKVIRKLEEFHQTNKPPESCTEDLEDKNLWHFSANPVVLVHIVWLWQKNKLRENMSHSALYQEIIDERWYDMCDKKEQYKDPHELYDVLSEIAFDKMLSENKDMSLVFNIKGIQLEKFKQFKEASLESGILSSSNVPGERFPQYQFLHKTFQEYFAAVFLSNRGSALFTSCKLVKNVYSNYRNESVFALEQVFLFLCGLNPDAAKEFSKTLNELFTEDCEKEGSALNAITFQAMILSGYDEAESSGHIGAKLCLQHIVLEHDTDLTEHQMTKLKLCLEDKRISNLKSLSIHGKSDIPSALQYMDNPSVLDLNICKNIKFLALEEVVYEDINLLSLNGLVGCNIHFSDYKPASKLISSVQSSDLRGLKILVLRNVGLECEAMDILSKLKCVKVLDLTWSKSIRTHDQPFDISHLEYLENLGLRGFSFSDVVNLQMLNLRSLTIGFRTQQQAPQLMAALLSNADGNTTTLDGSHFQIEGLRLKNVCMLAGEYMRLLNQMIQSGRKVDFKLTECTIEGDIREKVGDQAVLQVEAPQSFLTMTMPNIRLKKMTVSADVFLRIVLVVSQSRRLWDFTLTECTIEGDVRELHEKVGDQTALHVEAPQFVLPWYTTGIRLKKMTVSVDVILGIVLVMSQFRRSWDFTLTECTIEGAVRELHEKVRDQAALQVEAAPSFFTMTMTYICLKKMTVSADVFMRLVPVVSQSGREVYFTLTECTIEGAVRELHENVGDQAALQVEAPQSFLTSTSTKISLEKMTVSADVFMRLVLVVLQSGNISSVTLTECTIEGDVRELHEKVGDQTALQVEAPQSFLTSNSKHIILEKMTVSADVFMRLVLVVSQSGHIRGVRLTECTIEGDIRELHEKVGDQAALQVEAPQSFLTSNRKHIRLEKMTVSADVFMRFVLVVLQFGREVDFTLTKCTIEGDVRELHEKVGDQAVLQVEAPQPASSGFITYRISLQEAIVPAEVLRALVSVVLQLERRVSCKLQNCTIEPVEEVRKLQVKMEDQPAIDVEGFRMCGQVWCIQFSNNRLPVHAVR